MSIGSRCVMGDIRISMDRISSIDGGQAATTVSHLKPAPRSHVGAIGLTRDTRGRIQEHRVVPSRPASVARHDRYLHSRPQLAYGRHPYETLAHGRTSRSSARRTNAARVRRALVAAFFQRISASAGTLI